MIDVVDSLILDLLEWVAGTIAATKKLQCRNSTCPSYGWEDANERGLITQEWLNGRCSVRVTPARSHAFFSNTRRGAPGRRAETIDCAQPCDR